MWSSKAARVVVLPEPVGPVTSTSPRGRRLISSTIGGSPRLSRLGIALPRARRQAAVLLRCRYTFTRNRDTFGRA